MPAVTAARAAPRWCPRSPRTRVPARRAARIAAGDPRLELNLPNLITLARLLSVPLAIWLILDERYGAAFWVFVGAGVSDALDGYIAKRFDCRTRLGALLDPVADKALLASVYRRRSASPGSCRAGW